MKGRFAKEAVKIVGYMALIAVCIVMLRDDRKTFMTLYFQESVTRENSTDEIDPRYLQALQQALAELQIDSQQIELVLDPDSTRALQVRFADDALNARQRQDLRALFESFEPARETALLSGRLVVDMRQARQLGLGVYDFGPASKDIVAQGEVSLTLQFSFLPGTDVRLRRIEGPPVDQRLQAEMICEANARLLAALPFEVTEFDVSGADLRGEMKLRTPGGEQLQAPAQLFLDDRNLLERLEMGGMRVRILRPEAVQERAQADRLVFEFGSLGTIRYSPYSYFIRREPSVLDACGSYAYQSGRPFSFFLGEGLDRLVKVRFEQPG
ncbi:MULTISPECIES: hypothetical protein [Pseudomonas]|uniref:Uncharacterized protein n=1 Tax=Pseudomonas donghuensis TaxID=1163398 RepID=A0AAP0SF81_9PSED|nr:MULTISPECIES: hypothetical protein [Pseudomonas]MDF9895468.1 hypothetical protein [Pseudomonas vranovensis]KDN97342.1 hypothetical protein BV82_4893 [Pseudomonas donghuensis]MBF4208709.1 hypothetical protein [Pseudomonas donghuensis]MBS7597920.1 hypothetical protein [Pseudomonas sp. RC2C2]MCP6692726.1 hypothetical protein [Pseudomonas donghuensis]